jgi:glyoxylase-like metal-dependent hydrolase (beta-lactamase superfamily II)
MVRDPRSVEVVPIRHPRGCRSYVVVDPESREAAVVDPLLDHLRETIDALEAQRATLRWIVDTHSHGDHLSGAAALGARTGAAIVAHPKSPAGYATHRPADGERLPLGEQDLVVHHAPGITADALVLEAPGALFTGDTLLIGTVGLRDAPGSDGLAWYETLHRVFGGRSDETIVHPGHDDMGRDLTTLRAERTGNRWLREDDREAFLALYRGDGRSVRTDAPRILEANRTGLEKLPRDLEPASGLEAPAARPPSAPRRPPAPRPTETAPAGGAALAGLLVACGLLAAAGTVLGWLVAPWLHGLSLLAGLLLLGAGLPALEARRRRRPNEPELHYLGPSRHTAPSP